MRAVAPAFAPHVMVYVCARRMHEKHCHDRLRSLFGSLRMEFGRTVVSTDLVKSQFAKRLNVKFNAENVHGSTKTWRLRSIGAICDSCWQ